MGKQLFIAGIISEILGAIVCLIGHFYFDFQTLSFNNLFGILVFVFGVIGLFLLTIGSIARLEVR